MAALCWGGGEGGSVIVGHGVVNGGGELAVPLAAHPTSSTTLAPEGANVRRDPGANLRGEGGEGRGEGRGGRGEGGEREGRGRGGR